MLNFGSILTIIPFILFGVPLLFIFGLFMTGAFTLIFSGDPEKGKDAIAKALTYFIMLLAIFLVFIVVSYLIGMGGAFKPEEETDFPISPMGKFPPAPDFVVAGNYSFSGPWPFAEMKDRAEDYLYGVFCKKEHGYDIMDAGISQKRKPVSTSPNYECWLENCGNDQNNIYIGRYWTSPDEPYIGSTSLNKIQRDINFICGKEK